LRSESSAYVLTMSRLALASQAATVAASYKLRRALGARPRSLADVAERSWVIAPSIEEPAALPFIPDGHLARILRGSPRMPCPHETRSLITATRHVARETRAYLLRDAFLIDRNVYCGLHKEDLFRAAGPVAALLRERAGSLNQAVLATNYAAARWFGHFLHDELPLQLLARTIGTAVGHARPQYRHERAWRALLAVDAPPGYGLLHLRRLIVIDDIGQNLDKRARYRMLRARLAHLPRGHERVYLRRSARDGERRALVNAVEIEQRLAREGFRIVDTAAEKPDEIIRACAGASVVVSVEGSHAAPAFLLARDGACTLFICPPRRVDAILAQIAGFFGLFGALFVGEPVARPEEAFTVDPDELMRALDAAAAGANARAARQLAH
jgi:capsular polysaccharide biosynthesis protein